MATAKTARSRRTPSSPICRHYDPGGDHNLVPKHVRFPATLLVMPATRHHEVLPTTEVRAKLSQIAAEFERRGIGAEPVAFGSHRRPQGIILPWELWLEILPAIEDQLDAAEARQRLTEAGGERVSFDEAAQALTRDPRRYR